MTGRVLRGMSPVGLTVLTACVGSVLTVAVVVLPFLRFAYRAPALHVVLETVNAVIGLLVAFLVFGRYREQRRLQELLLVLAMLTVGTANLVLTAVPSALALAGDVDLSRWAPLAVRLMGTVLLAAAALSPSDVRVSRRSARRVVLLVAGLGVTAAAMVLTVGGRLPQAVDLTVTPEQSVRPVLEGHPVAMAVQVVSGLLYAVAAVAFTRQAVRTPDHLIQWVGAGCVLAAFARVHYLLFPSLYSEFVYTGDALRLAFYSLLLVGAVREIQSYWVLRTQNAVLEDRRRLARDLHDGLTQELTYIYSQTRLLRGRDTDPQVVEHINGAAARAIDEARTAIAALTQPLRPQFAEVVRESVEGLASRYDVKARVDVPDDLRLPPDQADAVLRIVAEAIRNAVRHGQALQVSVALREAPLRLSIEDDGRGFDPAASRTGSGFGLTSMRERAEGLGATFRLDSTPGAGTRVQVTGS